MILTTHILSGALIGAKIRNPFLIAAISIVVHFLLDMLPHGDYLNKKSRIREFWKVAIDLGIGLGVVLAMLYRYPPLDEISIAIGIFFSLLPDATTFLYLWMRMEFFQSLKKFHEGLHRYQNGAPEREFHLKNNLWDIIISLASLFLLLAHF